jgi:CRISPR-associated protein Cas2
MLILLAYDVNTEDKKGQKRLRRIAKLCENYGQRVQNSLFECLVDPAERAQLEQEIFEIFDPEKDSIRIYNLGKHWQSRVEHHGAKPSYDPEGNMVI